MECICRIDCQIRLVDGNKYVTKGGKITFIERDTVMELDKCPDSFEALTAETYAIDFATATEQELCAAKWTQKEAKEAMLEIYDKPLIIKSGDTKKDVAKAIIDMKYRSQDL